MSYSLEAGLWRAILPDGWDAEEEDDSLVLWAPSGPGTLQVTCSQMEDGFVDEDDLRYFAEELLDEGQEPARVSLGPLQGLKFEYMDDETGEAVTEWYLAADELFFFMTYSCPRTERGVEDATVDAILRSIELVDADERAEQDE